MKIKENAILIVSALILIATVILLATSNSEKQQKSSQATNQQSSGQTADHHGGQPAIDSKIFDSLVGKKAPEFSLESYSGEISLNALKGKNVVLFFSEGLMCYPACWNQIAAFGKDSRFNTANIAVLTIVNDRKEDWKSAVDKMPDLATATVLFDTTKSVSLDYGVLNLPSSMHRGQLAGHSYIIVDREGIVRFVKDDQQMAVRNEELLGEISKL